jgi:hypothetical protein
LKKDKPTIKKYNFFSYMSKFSLQFWKAYIKREYKKRDTFLIDMYLRNGKKDTFLISTSDNKFSYKKGLYVIDSDMSIDDIHSNFSRLIYHQDCSIPFKLDFNIDELNKKLINSSEVDKAINPRNLKGFIDSEVIEIVLKGQELSDEMRFLKLLLIGNVILSGIVLIIVAKSSGVF